MSRAFDCCHHRSYNDPIWTADPVSQLDAQDSKFREPAPAENEASNKNKVQAPAENVSRSFELMYLRQQRSEEEPPAEGERLEDLLEEWKHREQEEEFGNVTRRVAETFSIFKTKMQYVAGAGHIVSLLKKSSDYRLRKAEAQAHAAVAKAQRKLAHMKQRNGQLWQFVDHLKDTKYLTKQLHQLSAVDNYDVAVFFPTYDIDDNNDKKAKDCRQKSAAGVEQLESNFLAHIVAFQGSTAASHGMMIAGDQEDHGRKYCTRTIPSPAVLKSSKMYKGGCRYYSVAATSESLLHLASREDYVTEIQDLRHRSRPAKSGLIPGLTYAGPFDFRVLLDRKQSISKPYVMQGDYSCAKRVVSDKEIEHSALSQPAGTSVSAENECVPLQMRSCERQELLKLMLNEIMTKPPDIRQGLFDKYNINVVDKYGTNQINFLDKLGVDLSSRMHSTIFRQEISRTIESITTAVQAVVDEATEGRGEDRENCIEAFEERLEQIKEDMKGVTGGEDDEEDEENDEEEKRGYRVMAKLTERAQQVEKDIGKCRETLSDGAILSQLKGRLKDPVHVMQESADASLNENELYSLRLLESAPSLSQGILNRLLSAKNLRDDWIRQAFQQGIQALEPGYVELLDGKYMDLPLLDIEDLRFQLWCGAFNQHQKTGSLVSELTTLLGKMERSAVKTASDGEPADRASDGPADHLLDFVFYSREAYPAVQDAFKGWLPYRRICDVLRPHSKCSNCDVPVSVMADKGWARMKEKIKLSVYAISTRLLQGAIGFCEVQREKFETHVDGANREGLLALVSDAAQVIGSKLHKYRQLRDQGFSHNSDAVAVMMDKSSRFYCMIVKQNGKKCRPFGVDHVASCKCSIPHCKPKDCKRCSESRDCKKRCELSQCESCKLLTSKVEKNIFHPCSKEFMQGLESVVELLQHVANEHGTCIDKDKMSSMQCLLSQVKRADDGILPGSAVAACELSDMLSAVWSLGFTSVDFRANMTAYPLLSQQGIKSFSDQLLQGASIKAGITKAAAELRSALLMARELLPRMYDTAYVSPDKKHVFSALAALEETFGKIGLPYPDDNSDRSLEHTVNELAQFLRTENVERLEQLQYDFPMVYLAWCFCLVEKLLVAPDLNHRVCEVVGLLRSLNPLPIRQRNNGTNRIESSIASPFPMTVEQSDFPLEGLDDAKGAKDANDAAEKDAKDAKAAAAKLRVQGKEQEAAMVDQFCIGGKLFGALHAHKLAQGLEDLNTQLNTYIQEHVVNSKQEQQSEGSKTSTLTFKTYKELWSTHQLQMSSTGVTFPHSACLETSWLSALQSEPQVLDSNEIQKILDTELIQIIPLHDPVALRQLKSKFYSRFLEFTFGTPRKSFTAAHLATPRILLFNPVHRLFVCCQQCLTKVRGHDLNKGFQARLSYDDEGLQAVKEMLQTRFRVISMVLVDLYADSDQSKREGENRRLLTLGYDLKLKIILIHWFRIEGWDHDKDGITTRGIQPVQRVGSMKLCNVKSVKVFQASESAGVVGMALVRKGKRFHLASEEITFHAVDNAEETNVSWREEFWPNDKTLKPVENMEQWMSRFESLGYDIALERQISPGGADKKWKTKLSEEEKNEKLKRYLMNKDREMEKETFGGSKSDPSAVEMEIAVYDKLEEGKTLFDSIRDYLGEDIAFYFTLLNVMIRYMKMPAIVGMLVQIVRASQSDNDQGVFADGGTWYETDWGNVIVGIFTPCWMGIAFKDFERTQSVLAYQWGTYGKVQNTVKNPHFDGDQMMQGRYHRQEFIPCDDELDKAAQMIATNYQSPEFSRMVKWRSNLAFGLMLLGLVAVNVALMLLQTNTHNTSSKTDSETQLTGWGIGFLNGLVITCCSYLMKQNIIKLVEYENLTLQSDFDNSMIMKFFLFECVNNYASTVFTAFIVAGGALSKAGGDSVWGSDRSELCSELSGCISDVGDLGVSLMMSKFLIGSVMALVQPVITFHANRELFGKEYRPASNISAEDAYFCEDGRAGSIQNLADTCVTVGYSVMFAFAFPLAPLVTMVGLAAKFAVGGYNHTHHYRRPFRERVEGISTWLWLMKIILIVSVITFAMLLLITSDFMDDEFPDESKAWHGLVVAFFCFGMLAFLFLQHCRRDAPIELRHTQFLDSLEK